MGSVKVGKPQLIWVDADIWTAVLQTPSLSPLVLKSPNIFFIFVALGHVVFIFHRARVRKSTIFIWFIIKLYFSYVGSQTLRTTVGALTWARFLFCMCHNFSHSEDIWHCRGHKTLVQLHLWNINDYFSLIFTFFISNNNKNSYQLL